MKHKNLSHFTRVQTTTNQERRITTIPEVCNAMQRSAKKVRIVRVEQWNPVTQKTYRPIA